VPADQVASEPYRAMISRAAARFGVGPTGPESPTAQHQQEGIPVNCEAMADCEGNVECAVPAECDFDEACGKPDTEPRVTEEQIAELGLYEGASRGPAGAPVTIVVFGDFTCHLCGEVLGTIDELWDEYPAQLRLIVKPFVTNERAWLAAQAAHAAGDQGRFWAMHDLMYANQDDLSMSSLIDYAGQAGLDVDRFRADLESEAFKDTVAADLALAEELGIVGTPSFLINGKLFAGARPTDQFRASIDPELAKGSSP
jgi:predicted DsbA family dithiol-disulfide isomerase